MKATVAALMAGHLFFCHAVYSMPGDFRQEFVKKFTEAEQPFKYFESEEWEVEALFFDFDDDGTIEEALLASPDHHYADGNGWLPVRRNSKTGEIEHHPAVGESGISLHSHSRQLYVVSADGVRDRLYGNDVMVYDMKNHCAKDRSFNAYFDNVILSMDTNGFLRATSLANGFSDIVSDSGFRRIDRAVTEFYKGFAARLDRRTDVAPDIPTPAPNGFCDLASQYRADVKKRLAVESKVTVFAVFFDADNDGDSDCYISSDAEARHGGKFEWHLFLNGGGTFAKAGETVWFNADKWHRRESIEPNETAGKDSFYRIQRVQGFVPSIIILDKGGNTMHSRTAVRQQLSPPPLRLSMHLSYKQYMEYNSRREEWDREVTEKLGFAPAYDFDELLADSDFLRLERLICQSFPED